MFFYYKKPLSQRSGEYGVVIEVLEQLKKVPLSIHCWQGDGLN